MALLEKEIMTVIGEEENIGFWAHQQMSRHHPSCKQRVLVQHCLMCKQLSAERWARSRCPRTAEECNWKSPKCRQLNQASHLHRDGFEKKHHIVPRADFFKGSLCIALILPPWNNTSLLLISAKRKLC